MLRVDHKLSLTYVYCRARIAKDGRHAARELNFGVEDYTDEELPPSIYAFRDAIKEAQVL